MKAIAGPPTEEKEDTGAKKSKKRRKEEGEDEDEDDEEEDDDEDDEGDDAVAVAVPLVVVEELRRECFWPHMTARMDRSRRPSSASMRDARRDCVSWYASDVMSPCPRIAQQTREATGAAGRERRRWRC